MRGTSPLASTSSPMPAWLQSPTKGSWVSSPTGKMHTFGGSTFGSTRADVLARSAGLGSTFASSPEGQRAAVMAAPPRSPGSHAWVRCQSCDLVRMEGPHPGYCRECVPAHVQVIQDLQRQVFMQEQQVDHHRADAERHRTEKQEQLEDKEAQHELKLQELAREELSAMSQVQGDHYSKTAEMRVELQDLQAELAAAQQQLQEARTQVVVAEGSRDDVARQGQECIASLKERLKGCEQRSEEQQQQFEELLERECSALRNEKGEMAVSMLAERTKLLSQLEQDRDAHVARLHAEHGDLVEELKQQHREQHEALHGRHAERREQIEAAHADTRSELQRTQEALAALVKAKEQVDAQLSATLEENDTLKAAVRQSHGLLGALL